MVKTLSLMLVFSFLQSYSPVSSSGEAGLSIQANEPSYTVEQLLIVTTKFVNNLGRDVLINNTGCGFPAFILEKRVNEQWVGVGEPLCIALATSPTLLPNRKQVSATVQMTTEGMKNTPLTGIFRLRFFITDRDNGQSLPSGLLVSNSFEITR